MTSIPLLVTHPHPCSYLTQQLQAQTAFVSPEVKMNIPLYSFLIAHGFRRSGDEVYRPRCATCNQCVASRISVAQFKPNRSQQRCVKKHQHTETIIKTPVFDEQHYRLYLRYQQYKHPDSNMANSSADEYIGFLSSAWCDTRFVEFWLGTQLIAVAVVDFLANALSAVYTFFAPEFAAYSLGSYAVLWQIQQAQQLGLEYVYLGFWIKDCAKMTYKIHYRPLEGLINQNWQMLN